MNPATLERWQAAGILRGINLGKGPGNGIVFSRDEAIEAFAVASLRRAGVPLQRLRPLVDELRRRGWKGHDFLQVGAHGRTALVDGEGAGVPLRDAHGQLHLALVLDLRAMREQAESGVDSMTVQARA